MRRASAYVASLITIAAPLGAHAGESASNSSAWISFPPVASAPKTYHREGLTLTIRAQRSKHGFPVGVLTVRGGRTRPFQIVGSEGNLCCVGASLSVFRPTPHSSAVVLFRNYTGGAHCCLDYQLLSQAGGRWQAAELRRWDGSVAPSPKDLDGDGSVELVGGDGRFLYAFASYGESLTPPVVYEVRSGQLVDVSPSARYARVFADKLPRLERACEDKHSRGACAAFAATAARLGKLDEAWPIIERSIIPDELPESAPRPCENGETPSPPDIRTPHARYPGDSCRKEFATFRGALEWYLARLGYIGSGGAEAHQ